MLKIRRSHGGLIFNMGIPIPRNTVFILRRGPGALLPAILKLTLKFHGRLVKAICLGLHFGVNHKVSPGYWPFVRGINQTGQWIPVTKDQLGGLSIFFDVSLNKLFGWTKSLFAGALKRHDGHRQRFVDYAVSSLTYTLQRVIQAKIKETS